MTYPSLSRYRLSLSDYHWMIEVGILSEEDKVELLNGEIVNMSPKGSKHASCIRKIVSWLPQLIDKKVQLQVQDPIQIPD